mgnify:CR=1 FL=1
MNKEQLQQQIEDMKNKLVEMEAELNKPEVTINYWKLKERDMYFYVNYLGNVGYSYYEEKYQDDKSRYRVFKTKEEAERYAEYIKAEETLKRVIAEANEGWLPDWSGYVKNYYIRLYNNKLDLSCYTTTKVLPAFMYIKSKALVYKLLKEYEKEFKTYLSY